MPDLGNTSVFSQTDGSNNSGTAPSWSGSAAPSTLDDAGRALQGAVTREWNWRSYTLTATGTADAKVLTYSVAPAAYYNGQRFAFIANTTNTTTATLNVNSLGAKSIKSMLTGTLANLAAGDMVAGMYCEVAYNTSNDCFVWVNQKTPASALPTADASTAGIVELATTTETLTGTDTTRAVTPDGLAALWEQGADVASAGTISLGEGGYFNITGTTTITDIDFATDKAGRKAWVKFAGALTLTHNATTLILPGGANITTAAGDTAEFVSEGSDVVRCVAYTKADGTAVVVAASSGLTFIGIGGTSGANSVEFTGLSQFTSLVAHVSFYSNSNGDAATLALSSNNGSSYGFDKTLTNSVSAAGLMSSGFVTISNTKANGSNKTITPAMSRVSSSYTTTSTETVVTGIINAIKFTSVSGCNISVALYGVP